MLKKLGLFEEEGKEDIGWVRSELVREAMMVAASSGILVVPRGQRAEGTELRFAVTPCTVLPTRFPKRAYQAAERVQPIINKLVDRVSRDASWLRKCLKSTLEVDEFTRQLAEIFDISQQDCIPPHLQPPSFVVIRNDFMLSQPEGVSFYDSSIKHVEINTIAASFGMLSDRITRMHHRLYKRLQRICGAIVKLEAVEMETEELPVASVESTLVEGFACALEKYKDYCANVWKPPVSVNEGTPSELVIVIVVQPGEYNAFDQHHLQASIMERTGVRVVRMSLQDIWQRKIEPEKEGIDLGEPQPMLLKDGKGCCGLVMEAAIVYFRAGYTPADFPTKVFWDSRRYIEQTRAIKCPNIAVHLTGSKKIQQELAQPGVLERFLDASEIDELRSTFTGLYSLDIEEYNNNEDEFNGLLDSFASEPQKYVLKPQREGGGSNFYDEDLVDKLKSMRVNHKEELKAYIVQDRITPPIQQSFLLDSKPTGDVIETTVELGIFGAYVSTPMDGEEVEFHCNVSGGHLLRTKYKESKEVGVAAGFGFVDSPLLVDG
eukprot:m.105494 g.105494  ORF g.105494 m.105494 type:complete len:547 (+) comp9132_c3_seq3:165-1805(+)